MLIKVLYKVAGGALAAAASASPAAPVEFFLIFLQGVPALSSGYLLVSVDDLKKQRLLTFSGECGYDGDYSYVVPSEQAVPRLVELFESGQHLRFTAYPRGLHGPDDPRIGFLLPGSRRFADIRQRMLEQLRGRH